MHGPGLALGDAAETAVKLGKHGIERAALGDVEPVRSIGREHQVVGLQGVADTDGNGFLADRQMNRALDAIRGIELDNTLFDQPDRECRPKQAAIEVIRLQALALPGGRGGY